MHRLHQVKYKGHCLWLQFLYEDKLHKYPEELSTDTNTNFNLVITSIRIMKCAVETLTQEWPWKLRGTQYVSILKVNKVGVSMSFHKAVYESTS